MDADFAASLGEPFILGEDRAAVADGKKLVQPTLETAQLFRPWYSAPKLCAPSSITANP